MKRIGIGLLAAILCLSFVACGQKPAEETPESGTTTTTSSSASSTDALDPTGSSESTTAGEVSSDATTASQSSSGGVTSAPVVHATLPNINIKGKTVELLTHDSPESEESQAMIARFKEAYGATLKMTTVEWTDMQTMLNSRVMAENPPDVVVVRNADMYTYQLSGILKDISGLIDYNTPLWKDIKARNDDLKLTDKQYVAVIQQWVGWYVWYNKSIMLDNGIMDTPDKLYEQGKWTVSAMRELAKELTIRDGEQITQYGLGSNYDTLANCLMAARGTGTVKRNGSTFSSNINDSALADAYNLLYDLYAADKCMAPIDQHNNMFAKGRCAMLVDGSWLPDQRSIKALKTKGSIGLVPFPKWDGEPERQMGEYTCTGIPRNVKSTDPGMAFIHFQRYMAIDQDQLNKNREQIKSTRAMTDKELDYMNQATNYAVLGSGLGIPNSPQYSMSMMVAYGNAWSLAVEKYGPDLQKCIDELNAMAKG